MSFRARALPVEPAEHLPLRIPIQRQLVVLQPGKSRCLRLLPTSRASTVSGDSSVSRSTSQTVVGFGPSWWAMSALLVTRPEVEQALPAVGTCQRMEDRLVGSGASASGDSAAGITTFRPPCRWMRTEVTAVNFAAPGGAFLILAFLQRRTGLTNITSLSGVIRSVPLLSALFLLFALAAIGLPETSGFPGKLLIIVAALPSQTITGVAAVFGTALAAAAVLSAFSLSLTRPLAQSRGSHRRRPAAARAGLAAATGYAYAGGWGLSLADPGIVQADGRSQRGRVVRAVSGSARRSLLWPRLRTKCLVVDYNAKHFRGRPLVHQVVDTPCQKESMQQITAVV